MKNLKSEKGSITLFVLFSMIFFIMFLTTAYIASTNAERSQQESIARTKEIYEKDYENRQEIYNSFFDESLPTGYTRLEYLESTGTQWIDTGVKLNQNSRVKIKYQYLSTSSIARIFGDAHNSSNGWILTTQNGAINTKIQTLYGDEWKPLNYDTESIIPSTNIIEYERKGVNQYVNGELYYTNSSRTFETLNTVTMFGAYYNTLGLSSARIYNLSIYTDGNEITRNYIPCLDRNGTPCMYDTVSKQTFYNEGTGQFQFAVGGELPTGYKHVKYIRSGNDNKSISSPPLPRISIPFAFKNTMTLRWVQAAEMQSNNLAIYSGTTRMAFLNGWTTAGKITARYGTNSTSISASVAPNAGQIYDLRLASDGFYIDGVKQGDSNIVDYPNDAVIVNAYYANSWFVSISKIYLIQVIAQDGTLLLNAVPCLDNNNIPCLYDTVSKTTITKTPSNANDFLYEE